MCIRDRLLSYQDYERIRKNSDKYLSQNKNCDCKSKERKEEKIPDIVNQQGHGTSSDVDVTDATSYDVDIQKPKQIPLQFIQPQNVFQDIEFNTKILSMLPAMKKEKGRQLLKELEKKKNMSLSKDNEVVINNKRITGSDLKNLFDIVFSGVRRNSVTGETEFIDYLINENLGHYIESVEQNWYYIGDP